MLCGIWTCSEPVQALNAYRSMFTYNMLSLFLSLLCIVCFHMFFILSLLPCTPHLPQNKYEQCRVYYQCAYICACVRVCVTYCAPAESPAHHKDLSIRSAPSAIKTGSVYTWGKTLFLPLSFCLSQFVSPSSVLHRQHRQLTHTCTHTTATIESACYWDICQSVD